MTLQVQVVAPERVLWAGEAERVITRVEEGGDIAFLTGHAPFMGALGSGVTEILTDGGSVLRVAVHRGFVEVSDDRVSILSDTAEMADSVDVARAQQARDRASSALQDDDDEEARRAMARADTRLRAAEGATEG